MDTGKTDLPGGNQHKPRKWLTPTFIAEYCQVSNGTVLQWIKDNKLKAFSLPGGHYRIEKGVFREFLVHYGIPVEEWLLDTKSRKKGGKSNGC